MFKKFLVSLLFASSAVSAEVPTLDHDVRYVSQILRHDFAAYHIDRSLLTEITNSVVDAGRKYDIPFEPILVLMANESSFRPTIVSPVGAYGLMQINPPAWPGLVEQYDIKTVRGNIFAGAHVLRAYYEQCSEDMGCAVRAYNVGIGNQLRGRIQGSADKYWNTFQNTYAGIVAVKVESF